MLASSFFSLMFVSDQTEEKTISSFLVVFKFSISVDFWSLSHQLFFFLFLVSIFQVNEMLRYASLSSVAGLISSLRCCGIYILLASCSFSNRDWFSLGIQFFIANYLGLQYFLME